MNKLTLILVGYIFIGWAVIIAQNPTTYSHGPSDYPDHKVKQIKDKVSPAPYDVYIFGKYDGLAAMYINSGRGKEAMNILLDAIKNDAMYNDNDVIKKSSFDAHTYSVRIKRYLHTIDILSLLFRLGERLKVPDAEMADMLSEYMKSIEHPESLQEYVVALEYRLSFRHFEDIDKLLYQLKKYLHSNSWNPHIQLPFIYYYPYFKGRYLLLNGKYKEAEQYLGLALKFRPDHNGIAYSDLVEDYLNMKQDEKAEIAINSFLSKPRDTPEFMFFKNRFWE